MQPHSEFLHEMGVSLKNADAPCPTQVEQQQSQHSRRFNIYRNNRAVSLVENLKSTYPAVCKLVGDEFFNAAARHYIDLHPPTSPVMTEYGGNFGEFFQQLPNTQSIPYITDIARLEWFRLQSYHAKDAPTLAADILPTIPPDSYGTLCFTAHPSLFLLSSQWPTGGLWLATMQETGTPKPDMNSAEHVVIVRPELEVNMQVLPATGAMLLAELLQGKPLLQAVEDTAKQNASFDPGTDLQGLISLGVFETTYTKEP